MVNATATVIMRKRFIVHAPLLFLSSSPVQFRESPLPGHKRNLRASHRRGAIALRRSFQDRARRARKKLRRDTVRFTKSGEGSGAAQAAPEPPCGDDETDLAIYRLVLPFVSCWIGITSTRVATFFVSCRSYDALTFSPSRMSDSVAWRPSTWMTVVSVTSMVLRKRPEWTVGHLERARPRIRRSSRHPRAWSVVVLSTGATVTEEVLWPEKALFCCI